MDGSCGGLRQMAQTSVEDVDMVLAEGGSGWTKLAWEA